MAAGNQAYYLKDGLGNTVALCNGSGTVTATYTGACPELARRDVFGAVRSHTGTGSTEFTFTGEQNDPNGLEYLRARYYDNATGRFMGLDPRGSGYGYAGGNPVNRVDPTGLEWICPYSDYFGGDICFETDDLGTPADPACACFAYGGDPITDAYHEFMCGCTPDGGNHAAQATASGSVGGSATAATGSGGGNASATAGCGGPCSVCDGGCQISACHSGGCVIRVCDANPGLCHSDSFRDIVGEIFTPSCIGAALDVAGDIAGSTGAGVPVAAGLFAAGAAISASDNDLPGLGVGTTAQVLQPLGLAKYSPALQGIAENASHFAVGFSGIQCVASWFK